MCLVGVQDVFDMFFHLLEIVHFVLEGLLFRFELFCFSYKRISMIDSPFPTPRSSGFIPFSPYSPSFFFFGAAVEVLCGLPASHIPP